MANPGGAVVHWAAQYDLLISVLTLGRERAFREKLLRPARLMQGESVLDIGCGTGTLAISAARQVGRAKVTGIDPSPAMIARAKDKARRQTLDIAFEVAYAQSLPFPESAFDVVLSSLMLHHLPRADRFAALGEARRVLKPGGRILAVDFGADPSGKKGLIGHLHRHGGLPSRNLTQLISDGGFEVVESGPMLTWDLQFAVGRRM